MIATWMFYCSLCALGLAAAAALAERTLLAGRGSVRFLWIGAAALSLLVPAAAFRFAPRAAAADPAIVTDIQVAEQASAPALTNAAPISPVAQQRATGRDLRANLARLDQPLAVAWITLSLAVLFDFFGGIVVLAWMRRSWQRRTVHGIQVFVSEHTGPAVVGTVSPAIVLPEWVLGLDAEQLALMLRHEEEHRRAGDGRLIATAKLALIVMPWNVALWWQILRLRAAVELDCDARVLQHADARSYGDLLLEMARPRRGPRLMGATAFAERATQLERRIRVLSRHGTRTTRTARALATCIGLVALTVAWVAPHPPVPARAPATPPVPAPAEKPQELTAPATSTAPASNTNQPDAPRASVLPQTKIEDGPVSRVVPFTPPLLAVIDRPLQPIATVLPCARAGGPEVAPIVDDIFNRLFDGITLSREREARACEILIALHTKQAQHDETVNLTLVSSQAKRVLRDAALRELLTNDVDRATFDAHAAQAGRAGGRGGRGGGGGGRARSGGAAADTVAGGRAGRGGGIDTFNVTMITGGGGRGGARRGGGAGQEITLDSARLLLDMSNVVNNLTFRQLFEGIQLTPQQEARARELITNNQQEVRAQRVRPAGILRLNPATGVVSMEADGGAQLLALVSSEADRAKLESRITSVPR